MNHLHYEKIDNSTAIVNIVTHHDVTTYKWIMAFSKIIIHETLKKSSTKPKKNAYPQLLLAQIKYQNSICVLVD